MNRVWEWAKRLASSSLKAISRTGHKHFGCGYRLKVPVTVHVGIGYDIIHEHPNCDGAALGATSYTDFLILAHTVSQLEGGVVLNFGTQVMGPEVFLKALAMARNVAHQEGRRIDRFTTAVFDLVDLGEISGEPPKHDPATTSDRSRPYWFAPSPAVAKVSMFAATIA